VTEVAPCFQLPLHAQADRVCGLDGVLGASVLRMHLIASHSVECVNCSGLRGKVMTVWLRCVPVHDTRLMAFWLVSEFVTANMNWFG
jgi:hypothetical protein